MPRSSVGLILVVAGGVLIIVGLLAWLGALSWFGRLPGDIRIERSSGNRNLDREVLKAAKRWSFTAATENGRKVSSLVRVPFEFVPPC